MKSRINQGSVSKENSVLTFEEVSEQYGSEYAVNLFFEKLSKTFLKKLNFDEWNKISKIALPGSRIQKLSFKRLYRLAQTFDEWGVIYDNEKIHKKYRTISSRKMIETAHSFEEWDIVNSTFLFHLPVNIARDKMIETAHSFEEWMRVYRVAPEKSTYQDISLQKISKFPLIFDEWMLIFQKEDPESRLGILSFQKMSEFSMTFDKWEQVRVKPRFGREDEVLFVQKLYESAQTFEELMKVYLYEGSDLILKYKNSSLDKIYKTKLAFGDLLVIYCSIHYESEYDHLFFEKIVESACSFEEWNIVYQNARQEPYINISFQKMYQTASTVDEWKRMFRIVGSKSKYADLFINKISETTQTFEEWMNIYKNDSELELKTLAFKKMQEYIK